MTGFIRRDRGDFDDGVDGAEESVEEEGGKKFSRTLNVVVAIVVTTGIKPSPDIGNALVSAMYGRSSELGLYLWGNPPLPPVQGLPPPTGGG